MIAPLLIKNNCRVGKTIAFILTLITCLSMLLAVAPEAKGQGAELVAAEKVVSIVQGKDINYIVCFAGILSTAFSFYLVKLNIKQQDKMHELTIEQIKALRDLREDMKK